MKVKVGDKIYDGDETPIMVILNKQDKKLISELSPLGTKYCNYPDSMTMKEAAEFMETEDSFVRTEYSKE